jgi:hypothetical protein
MKLQNIGGVASLGFACLCAIFLVFHLLVFPRLGLVGPSDWIDPVKINAAWSTSPITFVLFNFVPILFGIALILIALSLRERMQAGVPNLMQIVFIGVSIACALLLAAAIIEMSVSPTIASAQNLPTRRAVTAMYVGLIFAGDHAMGWVLLVIGWAALKTRELPQILSFLTILYGIVLVLEFVVPPFMNVGVILGILWGVWLGGVLFRSELYGERIRQPKL